MAAADEVLAFNNQNNQNEIIRLLTQDINLHQETKRGLQKLTVKLNSWQQELTRLFDAIDIPRYNEQDVHEFNLLHKARQEEQQQRRDNMRAYWQAQNNPNAAALVPAVDKPIYTKHVILKNDFLVKGFDPIARSYIQPLLWEGKVSVADFTEDISICSFSQACNIPLSLSRMLNTAQQRGFGEKQYISLFLDFIKTYIPTGYQSALVYSKHLAGLFEYIISLVSSDSEVVKVRKALSNVRRKPGENLNEVVLKVQALSYMLYTMLQPSKEDTLIQKRASRTAMDSIFSLLSPPALEKYKSVKLKNNEMGHKMNLKEAISICNKIESVKGYELTTELLLPQKISQSDLYVAEYDLNINQTDLQKCGQRSARQRDYDRNGPRHTSVDKSTSSYQGPTRFSKDYARLAQNDRSSGRTSGSSRDGFSRPSSRDARPNSGHRRRSNDRSPRTSQSRVSPGGPIRSKSGSPQRYSSPGSFQRGKYGRSVRRQSQSPSRSSSSWADRFKSPVSRGLCVRCGSRDHKGSECKRYPWACPTTCGYCLHLFHQTDLCRFQNSRYVTPPRTPPYQSPVSFRKQLNCTQAQPEEGQAPVSNPNGLWAKNC